MRAGPAEAMRKEKEKQARNAGKLGNGAAVVAKKKISMSDYKKKASPAVAQGDNVVEAKVKAMEEAQPAEEKNNKGTNNCEQSSISSGETLHTTKVLQATAQSTIVSEMETSPEIQKNKPGEAQTKKPLDPRKRRLSDLPASTEAQPPVKKPRTAEIPADQEPDIAPKNSSEQVRTNTKEIKHITQQPASTIAPVKKLVATTTKQSLSAPSWRGHGEGVRRQPSSLPTPPHHEDSMPKDQHDLPNWRSSSNRHGLSTPPRLSNDFRKVDRTPPGRSAVPQRVEPTQVMSPPPSTSSPDSVRMSVTYSSNSSVGGDPIEEKKPTVSEKGVARKRPAPIADAASEHVHPVQAAVPEVARTVKADNSEEISRAEVASTSVPEDDELLVKLKFSKGFRKDVQRILQLKPSPRPISHNKPTQELPQKDNNTTASRNDKGLKHTRRPDDKEIYVPPAKRQKLDLPATKGAAPRTPLPPNNMLSAAVQSSPSSSLHRQVLTPKKDKDLTKKSSVSSLFQVSKPRQSTPQKPPPAISTPINTTQPTTTLPQTSTRPSDGAKWHAEHKRLSNIGRTLKHKMQEVTLNRTSPSTSTSDKHHHLAALHGIESLLAFMLSFGARELSFAPEKRAASALSTYSSMGPFGKEVSRACAPWPHLTGMVDLLLATCQGVVVKAAGTTGGYADPAAPADAERNEKKELERLTTAIRDMQKHADSAAKLLPLDVMSKEYPTAAMEAGHVSPFAGLGMQPSAAVKMGMAFLHEYSSKSAGKELGWEAALEFGDAGEL